MWDALLLICFLPPSFSPRLLLEKLGLIHLFTAAAPAAFAVGFQSCLIFYTKVGCWKGDEMMQIER